MEKTQEFHGLYHVLNGVISTFKGILPEDINIDSLVARVDDSVQEVMSQQTQQLKGKQRLYTLVNGWKAKIALSVV